MTNNPRWNEITVIWREYALQYRLLIIGLLVTGGLWLFGSNGLNLLDNMLGYLTNIFTEALSIVITVVILERLNARRQDAQELTRLKALIGSDEAVVTRIAIAELKVRGWLRDGSLQGVELFRANLSGAHLNFANLSGTNLVRTNLSEATLKEANLSGAHLRKANLSGASLRGVNLSGASLREANLSGAHLRRANLDNVRWIDEVGESPATLPDETTWTSETDMARFTDEKHPEYRSTLEKIEAIREAMKAQSE